MSLNRKKSSTLNVLLWLALALASLSVVSCDAALPDESLADYETDFTLDPGQSGWGYLMEGKTHEWTFTADKDAYIMVTAGDVDGEEGELTPYLTLKGPSGTELDYGFGSNGALVSVTAPAAGTYTVELKDQYDNSSGNYRIDLVVSGKTLTVSGTDQGGAILSGEQKTGNLALGDVDGWTFTAAAGDHIFAGLGDADGATGALTPYLVLVAPDGQVVDYEYGSSGAGVSGKAPEAGTYTLFVYDQYVDDSGNYTVDLVVSGGGLTITSGDQGGTITSGETKEGSLTLGDCDGWTFTAGAGDYIGASFGDADGVTGAITPYLYLITPDGDILDSSYGSDGAGVWGTAPEAGTYTLVITDQYQDDAGDYLVNLVVSGSGLTITSGDQGGTILAGEQKSGSLTLGDLDGWTFSASTGDYIVAAMGDGDGDSGEVTPYLTLVSPSGTVMDYSYGSSGTSVDALATETGVYTLYVYDQYFDDTGDYTLDLVVSGDTLTISTDDQGGTLSSATAASGTLVLGDLDGWTFTVSTGQDISIVVTDTSASGDITPYGFLLSPSGDLVDYGYSSSTLTLDHTATETGLYTLVVMDQYNDDTGTYRINLSLQ